MLDEFTESILYKVYRETDFEDSERVLIKILDELFPMLEEVAPNLQTDVSRFRILLSLCDMYLREGDISHSEDMMNDMRDCISSMSYDVENLKWLYFYNDKLALYHINRMEYEEAIRVIEKSIRSIEAVRDIIDIDDNLKEYLEGKTPQSRYLGNAYCMKVYAEMFLQRSDKDLYSKSLRADSEKALAEYHYVEELERNQQYRAHIEMVEGNCREALIWLLASKQIDTDIDGETDVSEVCFDYLVKASTEDHLSKDYSLMYYVEIMLEAGLTGDSGLSSQMHEALLHEKSIYEQVLAPDRLRSTIRSDQSDNPEVYEDFLWNGLRLPRRHYHPREITLWRYGTYLFYTDIGRSKAFSYWDRAIALCDKDSDYEWMQVIGLGINAERLARSIVGEIRIADQRKNAKEMMKQIDALKGNEAIPPKMKELIIKAEEIMNEHNRKMNDQPEKLAEELLCLAGMIAY